MECVYIFAMSVSGMVTMVTTAWLLQDWSGIPLMTASDPTSYQPNVAGRVLL